MRLFVIANLSLSEIQERHNGRLLVVLGISLQDIVDLLVILGGEIEGSVDIVVGRIIMLRIVPIDPHRSYLLSAAHVAETHRGLDITSPLVSIPWEQASLRLQYEQMQQKERGTFQELNMPLQEPTVP